jgi:hypothetical protein
MKKKSLFAVIAAVAISASPAFLLADEVHMKDGTVYKGKILIDTDKALLIGNPPYDPNSYLLETKDIEKIVYEEYKPAPPAERRRGFVFETRLTGSFFSSSQLPLSPAAGLYAGAGFRIHPLFELEAGFDYLPALKTSDHELSVTDGETVRRGYERFSMFGGRVGGRFYPWGTARRNWRTEPYLVAGYGWSRFKPKASGDTLKGNGWLVGVGAHRPLSRNFFLDLRFTYEPTKFGEIDFIGREGQISPKVDQKRFNLSAGVSYRL